MNSVQLGLLSAATAPFLLAIWAAFLNRQLAPAAVLDPPSGFLPSGTRFAAETLNLAAMAQVVAEALEPLAHAHHVRICLAVPQGMTVRADPGALRMALRETLLTAMRATPGGQVMLSALTVGTESHIRITDDGAEARQQRRESMARGAEELIALQGGRLIVVARPGRGTTVTIRLPMPGEGLAGGTVATPEPAMREPAAQTVVLSGQAA